MTDQERLDAIVDALNTLVDTEPEAVRDLLSKTVSVDGEIRGRPEYLTLGVQGAYDARGPHGNVAPDEDQAAFLSAVGLLNAVVGTVCGGAQLVAHFFEHGDGASELMGFSGIMARNHEQAEDWSDQIKRVRDIDLPMMLARHGRDPILMECLTPELIEEEADED